MLAEVKRGFPSWSGLLHPYLLLDTMGLLAALGGEIVPRYLVLIPHIGSQYAVNLVIFLAARHSPERDIKYEIDLLPNSVPPAKR